MTKQKIFSAFVVVTALGLATILVSVVLVMNGSQAFGATSPCPCESSNEIAFSPSLSGSPTPMYPQQGTLASGSGSHCGTLSLAYVCRKLAIDTSVSDVAQLINDKGKGVSMLDLARGAQTLGLEVEGVKTNLDGLKALPKPLIAFFPEWKHFVVVTEANDKGVTYVDLIGPTALGWHTPAEFANQWDGEVLVFSKDKFQSCTLLSDKEMAQYIGGETCGPCNKVIQKAGVYRKCEDLSDCSLTLYSTLFARYGCANKDASISCTEKPMHRGYIYPCRQGSGPLKCRPDLSAIPRVWGRINACR